MKDLRFIKHSPGSLHESRFDLLLEKEGYKGYGVYWALIENLFGQTNYAYPLKTIGLLATRLGLRKTFLLRIVTDYDLFHVTETHFSAPYLAETLKRWVRNPEKTTSSDDENPAGEAGLPPNQQSEKCEQIQEVECVHTTELPVVQPDFMYNSPEIRCKISDKDSLNDRRTCVEANYLPCNLLKMSNGRIQTRVDKEKDIDKEKTHTQLRAREKPGLYHCRDYL